MSLLDLIKNRYSCRAYQPLGVEKEKMAYVMECVRFAPSAVNKQPWRFRLISRPTDKAKLQECYDREWFKSAPMYVIASVLHDEEWVRADGKPHGNIDVAIAVEHLVLAAAEVGLGSCWVCNFDAPLLAKTFPLPHGYEAAALVPLGYPAAMPTEKKRKPVEEIWL